MKLSKLYVALFVSVPALANAETAQPVKQLDEVQVVALRDPTSYAKYVNTSQKLAKEDFAQATSVATALRYLPNVDSQGGARSVAQKPVIRGLSGNRVVQVVDGVRQNFDLAHRGSYFAPMSLIQEIEVVKGPSSTLWGSGALGGTVAMRTANALDLLRAGEQIGVKVRQGYQSADKRSETEAAVFGATERFDWLVQGAYSDADNLRLGSGARLPHSGSTQKGGMVKFGWQIDNANRVELSHRSSWLKQTAPSNNEALGELTNEDIYKLIGNWHRNNPRPSMPKMLAFYSGLESSLGNVSYLSHQKITDQNTALNYYFAPENNPYVNAKFTLYQNRTLEKETRVQSGLKDQTKLSTTGFNARNTSNFNGFSFTYGVDYYQDHANTARGTNNSDGQFRANPYNAKSKVTGAYLLSYLPLGKHLILSPSIRYDHYKSSSEASKSSSHHWSPSIALTLKATNWLDLTAKYNEAFRAPSLQERFVSGSHFGLASNRGNMVNTFIANPELKPEVAKNKEINASFHFEDVFAQQDKLYFNATYFQNDVKDFINLEVFKQNPRNPFELIPLSSQYQNVTNARLHGVELAAEYQTERFNLGVSYGETRGKNKANGEPLANIAANKISANVGYEIIADYLTVGARVSHYEPQKRVPKGNEQRYKGYTLTDVFATYAPKQGLLKNVRFDFGIDNLFDRQYQPTFSLMEGVGRNVKVNASYQF